MSEYRYLVYDLASKAFVNEVRFTSFQYNRVLKRDDGWSAEISVNDPKATQLTFAAGQRTVWVVLDDVIVFGGILWTATWSGNQLQLGGEGFLSYYSNTRRTVQNAVGMLTTDLGITPSGVYTEITWSQQDQFNIVRDLVRHANANTMGASGGLLDYDAGLGTVGLDWANITAGTTGVVAFSNVLISKTIFTYERRGIYELIEELSKATLLPSGVTAGFDFFVRYQWSGTTPAAPQRYLQLVYPRTGNLTGYLEEGKNAVIESYTIDGSKLANDVSVAGSGSGDGKVYGRAVDSTTMYPAGLNVYLESVKSLSGEGLAANLTAQAQSELALTRVPLETINVQVDDTTDSKLGLMNPGDTVKLKADRGFLTLNDTYRLVVLSVQISDLGIAKQKISLASLGASTGKF